MLAGRSGRQDSGRLTSRCGICAPAVLLCAVGALASRGANTTVAEDSAKQDLQLARAACEQILEAATEVPEEGRAYKAYWKCQVVRPPGGLLSASSSPEDDCADFVRMYQTAVHYGGGKDSREFCATAEGLRRPDVDPELDPLIAKHRACVSEFGELLASNGVQAAVKASCLRLYPWPDGPNIARKETCVRYAEEISLSAGIGVIDTPRVCDRALTGIDTSGFDAKHFVYSCERYAHNLAARARAGEPWEKLTEEASGQCAKAIHDSSGSFCEEYVRLVHKGAPNETELLCQAQYRRMHQVHASGGAVEDPISILPQDEGEQILPLSAAPAGSTGGAPATEAEQAAEEPGEEDEPIAVEELSTEEPGERSSAPEPSAPADEEPGELSSVPEPSAPAAEEPEPPATAVDEQPPPAATTSQGSEGLQGGVAGGGPGNFRMNLDGATEGGRARRMNIGGSSARAATDPFAGHRLVRASAWPGIAKLPNLHAAASVVPQPARRHLRAAAPSASHAAVPPRRAAAARRLAHASAPAPTELPAAKKGTGRYGKFLDGLLKPRPSLLADAAPDAAAGATVAPADGDRDGDDDPWASILGPDVGEAIGMDALA